MSNIGTYLHSLIAIGIILFMVLAVRAKKQRALAHQRLSAEKRERLVAQLDRVYNSKAGD